MPLVRIRHERGVPGWTLKSLQVGLPQAVADCFACSEGPLTPDDIELQFDEASPFDTNGRLITFDIEMMGYPRRLVNRDDRTRKLGGMIKEIVGGDMQFGLWVKLVPASWTDSLEL